VTIDVFLDN